MSEVSQPGRGRWQFSLASLLLLTGLVAVSIFAAQERAERRSLEARLHYTEVELENTRRSLEATQREVPIPNSRP